MSCQTASSVVGTWNLFIDWACLDAPHQTSITFIGNGNWSSADGQSGHWIQVEGLVLWNVHDTPDMCWAANVTNNALNGGFGYARGQSNPAPDSKGSFYAVRVHA